MLDQINATVQAVADPWKLSAAVIAVYLAYQILITVYSLYFGPLSKFPGPPAWAATNLPIVRMLWAGKDATTIHALHEKYGPVVRISPHELSFTSEQAWRDIYGHRTGAKDKVFEKERNFYALPVNGVDSLITADNATHIRHRRILTHAFSNKALEEQEPLLQEWANVLVEKLREKADGVTRLDAVSYYNFTTFDIMGDLTFAEPLGMLEGSQYVPWVKTIFASIKAGTRLFTMQRLPGMKWLLYQILNRTPLHAKQVEHFTYATDRVDRRLAKTPERPDLWTAILKGSGGGGDGVDGKMTIKEMHSNGSVFMIAGTETTATLLSGLTWYLSKDPSKMDRLVKEVRSTFASQSDITIETLKQMPYLNACVEEGLRCYPPVPTGLPRVTPEGGAAINGEWVPQGTIVSVHHFAAYRSPANFTDPDTFAPERWIAGEDEHYVKDNKAAFQPFSTGPRNCIGRNLAYHEIRLLLSSVLLNFDVQLCPESNEWIDQPVYILWEKTPLWVTVEPRS